jgi:glycosyltransferase involved in cell wall biosynthesis
MKITAVCCTCNRPITLGRIIKCFERQTYPDRELVILDDLGQYNNQTGDRWRLVSVTQRFPTLGEKRNACAEFATGDFLAVWDDDDFYYPHALESLVEALEVAQLVQPRVAMDFRPDGTLVCQETFRKPGFYAYHGCWGYRREAFLRVGGYPAINCGDDGELQGRFQAAKIRSIDIKTPPFYVYNRVFPGKRISEIPLRGALESMAEGAHWIGTVPIWDSDDDWNVPIPKAVYPRPW